MFLQYTDEIMPEMPKTTATETPEVPPEFPTEEDEEILKELPVKEEV